MTNPSFVSVLCLPALVLAGCQTLPPSPAKQDAQRAWEAQRGALKYELANAEFRRGRPEEALPLAQEATALSPDKPAHAELLARVYLAKGDFPAAKNVLQIIRQKHPEFAEAAYLQGTLWERERNWEGALEAYGRAVALKPEQLDYRIALAQAVAQSGKPAEAIALLRDEEARFAAEPLYHLARAELCRETGDLTQACAAYERALRLGSNDSATRQSLGLCLYWLGRGREALEYLEPLVRDQKQPDAAVACAFAGCLLANNQSRQALEWLGRFTRQRPDHGPLWLLLAQARSACDDAPGAVQAARRAAQLLPDAPEAQAVLAAVCLAANQLEAAEEAIRKVLRGDAADADAWLLFGRIRERRGDRPAAAQAYRAALETAPDNPLAAQLLARLAP